MLDVLLDQRSKGLLKRSKDTSNIRPGLQIFIFWVFGKTILGIMLNNLTTRVLVDLKWIFTHYFVLLFGVLHMACDLLCAYYDFVYCACKRSLAYIEYDLWCNGVITQGHVHKTCNLKL